MVMFEKQSIVVSPPESLHQMEFIAMWMPHVIEPIVA